MALGLFLATLLGTMAIGIPIAFALLLGALALMIHLDMFDTIIVAQHLIGGANNFPMLAIPFFILAGEIMNASGISKRIIDFAMSWVGHIKGGLGYVAIITSIIFAGLSGSAVADTAALGAILIPMMAKEGYDKRRSAGLLAAGGIIAPVIPPSIPMIVFGVASGVSITKLFMAGIVPGILMGVGLMLTWSLVARKGNVEPRPKKSLRERLSATKSAVWGLFLPIFIILGLRGGIFTPTEAGVVAAVYALFVGAVVYRELKLKELYHVMKQAVKMTSVVMFLVAGAMVSAWMITIANIPAIVSDFLGPFMGNQTLFLFVVVILVLVVGTTMDTTPIILILTPVLMPLVQMLGIDPVYFGLIFVISSSLGLITPPVGAVLNVAAGVGKMQMDDIVRGVWPFLISHVVVLFLLIFFPWLVTVPLEWFTK